MNFFGTPIVLAPASCPPEPHEREICLANHFGIPVERAKLIVEAIKAHFETCKRNNGKADYLRFIAGPELELESPAEVYGAGYLMAAYAAQLQQWEKVVELNQPFRN